MALPCHWGSRPWACSPHWEHRRPWWGLPVSLPAGWCYCNPSAVWSSQCSAVHLHVCCTHGSAHLWIPLALPAGQKDPSLVFRVDRTQIISEWWMHQAVSVHQLFIQIATEVDFGRCCIFHLFSQSSFVFNEERTFTKHQFTPTLETFFLNNRAWTHSEYTSVPPERIYDSRVSVFHPFELSTSLTLETDEIGKVGTIL